jgi:predicted DNA-binding transcriptional regulator YafY
MAFPIGDRTMFLSWIAGFAADAVVLEPEDLRAEVIARLERAAG